MQTKYFREQPYYSQLQDTRPKFDTSEHTLQTKISVQFPLPTVIVSLLVGVGTCACAVVSTMSVTWGGKAASYTVRQQCECMDGSIPLKHMDQNVPLKQPGG